MHVSGFKVWVFVMFYYIWLDFDEEIDHSIKHTSVLHVAFSFGSPFNHSWWFSANHFYQMLFLPILWHLFSKTLNHQEDIPLYKTYFGSLCCSFLFFYISPTILDSVPITSIYFLPFFYIYFQRLQVSLRHSLYFFWAYIEKIFH